MGGAATDAVLDAASAAVHGLVGEVVADAAEFERRVVVVDCEQLAGVAPIAARQTERLVTRAGRPAIWRPICETN